MALAREKIIVEPGSGHTVTLPTGLHTFKVLGEQTSGAFSVLEIALPPGVLVPPHRHERTDEVAYILEGELGVMVAGEEFQVGVGAFVVRPKGVPHSFWSVGDRPVRLLDVSTPAGFEAWFDQLARLRSSIPPPTMQELTETARRYDVIVMPELAPPLMQKYGLRMPG
jgi:mannose-6-phosphate isomerase-like protein (cupin superfamily)